MIISAQPTVESETAPWIEGHQRQATAHEVVTKITTSWNHLAILVEGDFAIDIRSCR